MGGGTPILEDGSEPLPYLPSVFDPFQSDGSLFQARSDTGETHPVDLLRGGRVVPGLTQLEVMTWPTCLESMCG